MKKKSRDFVLPNERREMECASDSVEKEVALEAFVHHMFMLLLYGCTCRGAVTDVICAWFVCYVERVKSST